MFIQHNLNMRISQLQTLQLCTVIPHLPLLALSNIWDEHGICMGFTVKYGNALSWFQGGCLLANAAAPGHSGAHQYQAICEGLNEVRSHFTS